MSYSSKAFEYLKELEFHALFVSNNIKSDILFNHYHSISDKDHDVKILEDNYIPYKLIRTMPEYSENNFRIDVYKSDIISIIRDKKINSILNE